MITAEIAIVKPVSFAEIFAPAVAEASSDVDFADLADEPTDAEYDAMADEALAMNRLDAGLLPW